MIWWKKQRFSNRDQRWKENDDAGSHFFLRWRWRRRINRQVLWYLFPLTLFLLHMRSSFLRFPCIFRKHSLLDSENSFFFLFTPQQQSIIERFNRIKWRKEKLRLLLFSSPPMIENQSNPIFSSHSFRGMFNLIRRNSILI